MQGGVKTLPAPLWKGRPGLKKRTAFEVYVADIAEADLLPST